jgi:hypothetical protein
MYKKLYMEATESDQGDKKKGRRKKKDGNGPP